MKKRPLENSMTTIHILCSHNVQSELKEREMSTLCPLKTWSNAPILRLAGGGLDTVHGVSYGVLLLCC